MAGCWAPLNFEQHGHMKVDEAGSIKSLENTHLVPVVVAELASVATELPVFFVKNAETGRLELIALMGFREGKNVYFDNGIWRGTHIPLFVRNSPFLMASLEGDKYALCVDESSTHFNAHHGEVLFGVNGEQSEYLKRKVEELLSYREKQLITKDYLDSLLESELLTEQSLNIDVANGESMSIDGVYQIDMKKLAGLTDEKFLDLRKRGYLTALYAQVLSMQKLRELIRLSIAK